MKPAFKVSVEGSDITQKIADRLISLIVTDEAGVKSDRVEIVIDDRDQVLEIPRSKAKINVQIGYENRLVDKGSYIVEERALTGPVRTLTIRANAVGASRGAGAAKERSWDDTTLGGIARSIASERGWTPAISPELDGIEIEHEDQSENDLQFLSRLAMDNGAVAKIAHDRLIIAPHGQGKTVSGKPAQRVRIVCDETTQWEMLLAERGDYDGVKADYYDVAEGERGEAISGEDGENTHTLPHTYATKDQARRAAKAKRRALKRGKGTFNITSMPGVPELEAESVVDAVGFRTGVDGEWVASTVTHSITDGGYTTSVACETPEADSKPITDTEDEEEW